MHADTNLYNQLNATLVEIDTAIGGLKKVAEKDGISWLALHDGQGNNFASRYLPARAHVLQAMTAIKMGAKK